MTYVAPVAATVKARYPEFMSVADALVTLVLAEAITDVDERWIEADRARAQMALCAHYLAVEGEPGRSSAIASGNAHDPLIGPIRSDKVGDVATEYLGHGSGNSSGGITKEDYHRTPYGSQFLKLRARSFPAVVAV